MKEKISKLIFKKNANYNLLNSLNINSNNFTSLQKYFYL